MLFFQKRSFKKYYIYRIELISGIIIHGGKGISVLFILGCNIHLFLKLGNRKFQEEVDRDILGRSPIKKGGCEKFEFRSD